jgi:thymidylate synthase (FAD)
MPKSNPGAESGRVQRFRAPALERVLGRRFPVLDDGFVRVVDYMGTDASIVQAARVSYTLQADDYGPEKQRHLIRFLMRHRHTTPFEMCEIKLHVRVPMDCWRQWIRHRTANVNEYSTRYSVAIDSGQETAPTEWRSQAASNKQGSGACLEKKIGQTLSRREKELHRLSKAVYQERLKAGVAREQARKDLPLSTYTEAFWKIDLHNILHFLSLRMDAHAQQEIRNYANVIGDEIVKRWCPVAWDAFQDYRLKAITLTRAETEIIEALMRDKVPHAVRVATQNGMLDESGKRKQGSRELAELEGKFARMGIEVPWE